MFKIFSYESQEYNKFINQAYNELSITSDVCRGSLDFQEQRFRDNQIKTNNISFLVVEEDKPVLGYFGLSYQKDGNNFIGMYDYGNHCYMDDSWSKTKRARKFVKKLFEKHISSYSFIRHKTDLVKRSINIYDNNLLNYHNKKLDIYEVKIINLETNNLEDIWGALRSRYKSLINTSLKEDDYYLFDKETINEHVINEFRDLHIKQSGRETRSKETWNLLLQMTLREEGFLSCRYKNKKLISAGFFNHNSFHCGYGISASIKDKNSSGFHAVLWKAIEYAYQNSLKIFELGITNKLFNSDIILTEKEKGIAKFKSGYGGENFISIDIQNNT